MLIRQIYDPVLSQYAYLVGCQKTKEAILVDPQRDIERYAEIAAEEGVKITHVTETHIHADFLSGCRQASKDWGVKVLLSGEGGDDWKYEWLSEDGVNGQELKNGDTFDIGHIRFEVRHTPGHTPEHIVFVITDKGGGAAEPIGVLTGDFIFVGALGRPDLLEAAVGLDGARIESAKELYRSARSFLDHEDFWQIWPGHGAGSACGKSLSAIPHSTLGYEKRYNESLITSSGDEDIFVNSILEDQSDPPLYFSRMKESNRKGPEYLERTVHPDSLSPDAFCELASRNEVTVVDTRSDRVAFVNGHIKSSIYAPVSKSFAGLVGSYVEPNTEIVLIVDESKLDEAVLSMMRIGLDKVTGYITPERLFESDAAKSLTVSIPRTSFQKLNEFGTEYVLDARNWFEYNKEHVDGAGNIAHTRLAEHLDELPKDKKIAVHCLSGGRACPAVSYLAKNGFDVVYVDDKFVNHRDMLVES